MNEILYILILTYQESTALIDKMKLIDNTNSWLYCGRNDYSFKYDRSDDYFDINEKEKEFKRIFKKDYRQTNNYQLIPIDRKTFDIILEKDFYYYFGMPVSDLFLELKLLEYQI